MKGDFGKRLKVLREGKNVSKKDLAKVIDATAGYITHLEKGEFDDLPASSILKIANHLQADAADLMFMAWSERGYGVMSLKAGDERKTLLGSQLYCKWDSLPSEKVEKILEILDFDGGSTVQFSLF